MWGGRCACKEPTPSSTWQCKGLWGSCPAQGGVSPSLCPLLWGYCPHGGLLCPDSPSNASSLNARGAQYGSLTWSHLGPPQT